MQTQYDHLRFYSKSELARLAGVSARTFRRYLATRRAILTAMGVSPFARKLPPQAVHYISEDYCIDLPPCLKWLLRHLNIKSHRSPLRERLRKPYKTHRVSRDTKTHRESSASATLCLHPSLGGRPWLGECLFSSFSAPEKRTINKKK